MIWTKCELSNGWPVVVLGFDGNEPGTSNTIIRLSPYQAGVVADELKDALEQGKQLWANSHRPPYEEMKK